MQVRGPESSSHPHADSLSAGIDTVGGTRRLLPRLALTHECPELDVHHDLHLRYAALP